MRLTARLPAWSKEKEEKDLVQCQGAGTGGGSCKLPLPRCIA